jgi:O-antigen biosynthesis protein
MASCIMPSANRRGFVPWALRMFLAQDYGNKELLIIDDGDDAVSDLIPAHPQIRYLRAEPGRTLGAKRNLGCECARGEIILHWDDDDWYAPWRIGYQLERLQVGDFDLCGIACAFFVDTHGGQAWEYVYPGGRSPWLCGAALCYRKSFWEEHRFPDVRVGEDTRFVSSARGARVGMLEDNRFFVARIHAGNTCPKRPVGGRWQARPVQLIQSMVGGDWGLYFGGVGGLPASAAL